MYLQIKWQLSRTDRNQSALYIYYFIISHLIKVHKFQTLLLRPNSGKSMIRIKIMLIIKDNIQIKKDSPRKTNGQSQGYHKSRVMKTSG